MIYDSSNRDITKSSTSTTELDFSTSTSTNAGKRNILEEFKSSQSNSDKNRAPSSDPEYPTVLVSSPGKCILENPNFDAIGSMVRLIVLYSLNINLYSIKH